MGQAPSRLRESVTRPKAPRVHEPRPCFARSATSTRSVSGRRFGAQDRTRRALERDEKSGAALSALAGLHRTPQASADLLEVLRRELKLAADKDRQLELHLEMAKAADHAEGGDLRLRSARIATRLRDRSRECGGAVGIERLCRREGNWDVLAEALKRAPRTSATCAPCAKRWSTWSAGRAGESREAELRC